MKKFILFCLAIAISAIAYAQSDTTLVKDPIKFETEVYTSKSGKTTTKYYAIYKGKYYDTTKTAYKRYNDAIRFHGTPNVAIVENEKKTYSKIIVL